MRVVYYTSPFFLDTAIEIINVLKEKVELHVVVEIAPTSKSGTIVNVQQLPGRPCLVAPKDLLDAGNFQKMEPYLAGLASIYFIVHPRDNGLSVSTWKASQLVLKHIRKLKPDVIHLDAKSLRFITMAPYLYFFKRVYSTIHDPHPHSGEDHFKARLIRFLSLGVAKHYFFYSEYALKEFKRLEPGNKKHTWQLRLYPLTFFRKYLKPVSVERNIILFFGRLSPYKGIDLFLEAIPGILRDFPGAQFVIAGRSIDGYTVDERTINENSQRIRLLNRYISNEELAELFSQAQMVVCPYKDATQSGVLVTALALNVPVVASNAGAFPEYIVENENGVTVPVNNAAALTDAIRHLLSNNRYQVISEKIRIKNADNLWGRNIAELLLAYNQT